MSASRVPEEEGHDGLAEHREHEAERRRGHRGPLGPRLLQDARTPAARFVVSLCREEDQVPALGPVQSGEGVKLWRPALLRGRCSAAC